MIIYGDDTINDVLTGTVDGDELYGLGGDDMLDSSAGERIHRTG